jgi:hypothetical protein
MSSAERPGSAAYDMTTESTGKEEIREVARERRAEVKFESVATSEDAGSHSSFRADRSHCRGWSSHMSSISVYGGLHYIISMKILGRVWKARTQDAKKT